MKNEYIKIYQPFEPVYDEFSTILILGTMASVKSREQNFYYGHPQNRFWRVISQVTKSELPVTVDEKKEMLLINKIAIWDVLQSCEIIGSSDSSIRNPVANNFSQMLTNTGITKIFTNGKTADKLYVKLCEKHTRIKSICLPSTSPANAAYNLQRLVDEWKCIRL